MTRWLTPALWTLAAAAVLGMSFGSGTDRVEAKPPKGRAGGPGGKGGKGGPEERAGRDLQHAYDTIREVGLWLRSDNRAPKGAQGWLDHAKEFYRKAERAYRDGDTFRAGELAKAANDTARGLRHLLAANAPDVAGLPRPPAGMGRDDTAELMRRAQERIDSGVTPARGPGRAFLDSSRRLLEQAREASRGDNPAHAADLARAAEAWSHVSEHLSRAEDSERPAPERRGPGAPPPPPEGRRGRPLPPRDRDADVPPPPPPPGS